MADPPDQDAPLPESADQDHRSPALSADQGTDGRPYRPAPEAVLWAIRLLAIAAALVSGFLLYQAMTAGPAGCAGGGDCSAVITSSYGKWLGVPVSLLAVGLYLGVLIASFRTGPRQRLEERRLAWQVMTLFGFAVLGAAAWFVYVQMAILGTWCIYCMTAHTLGSIMALIILVRGPWLWGGEPDDPPVGLVGGQAAWPMLAGLGAVFLLVGGQILLPSEGQGMVLADPNGGGPGSGWRDGARQLPADGLKAEDGSHIITLGQNQIRVSPGSFPTKGSPNAERVVLVVFDYTCPFCRAMHSQLDKVLERYGDQLAFVMLPMPLDADCNDLLLETEARHEHACDYAQLSMAMFATAPEAWTNYDAWLTQSSEDPPPVEEARAKALEMVEDDDAFRVAVGSKEIASQLQRNIRLYEMAGAGSLPMMVGNNMLVFGKPSSDEAFFELLEAELGVSPVSGAEAAGAAAGDG